MNNHSKEEPWLLIPIAGILLFMVLYVIATFYYPGGSTLKPTHQGFDWINNYWCDLIARTAKNAGRNSIKSEVIDSVSKPIIVFLVS